MEKLVYFWVDDFRILKNIGINLGPKYFFNVEKVKKEDGETLRISRKQNRDFIENFFHLENGGQSISNITAIVGENASGKSSLLYAIRKVLNISSSSLDRIVFGYLLITEKEGKLMYYTNREVDNIELLLDIRKDTSSVSLKTIFYSSVIDLLNITPGEKWDIDISSNALLYYDCDSSVSFREIYSIIDIHKWGDTERQLEFLNSLTTEKREKIEKIISLPKKLTVFLGKVTLESESRNKMRKNSIAWSIYSNLRDRFYTPINSFIGLSEDDLNHNNYFNAERYHTLRQNILWMFIDSFFNSVNFDFTDEYFESNKCLDEVKSASRLEEAFRLFLTKQNTINKPACENFLDVLLKLGEKIEIPEGDKIDSFDVSITDAKKLLNAYMKYLDAIAQSKDKHPYNVGHQRDTTRYNYPYLYNFLQFEWSELSTGEKAYLNLFSRFYYAKEKDRKDGQGETLLLLIDEGELGFHFQWQKEYVYNLITLLPHIFGERNIQIIFTTHSPITLSDIPKSNIVFLKKDEDTRETKVVKSKNNTFAANINELLIDSFFLRDGLAGKFAQEKIGELIKSIKNKQGDAKDHGRIEKIIGEPILKEYIRGLICSNYDKD